MIFSRGKEITKEERRKDTSKGRIRNSRGCFDNGTGQSTQTRVNKIGHCPVDDSQDTDNCQSFE